MAGQPAFQPTDEQRKNVEILVGLGLRQEEICRLVRDRKDKPISVPTLEKHFRKEIDTGATKANATVGSFVMATIRGSEPPTGFQPLNDAKARMRFTELWLHHRMGWQPASTVALANAGGQPLVHSALRYRLEALTPSVYSFPFMSRSSGRPLEPHHAAWLAAHPHRTEEWLRARLADSFDVHHRDGEHDNDSPDNLVLIEHTDHMSLHGMYDSAFRRRSRGAEARAAHGPSAEIDGGVAGRGPAATGGGCYTCRPAAQLPRGQEHDF
jgi:hypothetical protein